MSQDCNLRQNSNTSLSRIFTLPCLDFCFWLRIYSFTSNKVLLIPISVDLAQVSVFSKCLARVLLSEL